MPLKSSILAIEDDIVDSMLLKRVFSKLGIQNKLILKRNGKQGLEYLRSTSIFPTLILLDINMPVMSGLEFLEVIKKDKFLRMIPVIVLTTSKHQGDKIQSFNLGIIGYLVKPSEFSKFISMMKAVKEYLEYNEFPQ